MKLLITGTNSFVGRSIIKFSKFREIDEISLLEKNPDNIDFRAYDIVIHLVAIVHQTIRIPAEQYFRINRDLCIDVAKYAKKAGVRQLIFLSTVKVYGKFVKGRSHWNEESECFPDDSYGKSKYAAEVALKELNDENFIVSIVRTPLVYGENVRANMLSILKLVKHFKILPFANINNRRCFTSAENLVGFIDRIIEKKAAGIFIAMDKEAISTSQLVEMISENFNKKIILFKMPDFLIGLGKYIAPRLIERLFGSYQMDNSKTLKILDFEPPIATREGIRRMVKSFIEEKYD